MKIPRVLVACEHTGAVRNAFIAAGCDAVSCDLLPSTAGLPHYQGDVRDVLALGWDLIVAHPPCTYLSSSGMHWTVRGLRDPKLTTDAIAFAELLWDAPAGATVIENPVGCLSTRSKLGPATQIIQPHEYGHDASKRTCLWIKGLPALVPTQHVAPRLVNGRPRWANQTDSGQNRLAPSPDRWALRSATYAGIAHAMAAQWTPYLKAMH